MALSHEQRKARLGEALNGYDQQALTTADFLRQLRLAHSEGLLAGLLRQIGAPDHQVAVLRMGAPSDRAAPKIRAIRSPLPHPRGLRSGWSPAFRRLWSRCAAWFSSRSRKPSYTAPH